MWLIPAFFVTAVLYASVGFGGGSTYSALLSLAGFDYRLLPVVSLCCNVVVVLGSSVRFARAGITPWKPALLLAAIAAPMAYLGGRTPIAEQAFLVLLGISLLGAGLTLLLPRRDGENTTPHGLARFLPLAAAPLGYLAGLTGIGGGIFLAPLLHLTRWSNARAIAASTALFILINSLAGLAGQASKLGTAGFAMALTDALPLLLAVVIGGQIGSLLALRILPEKILRWLTAALTIWAGSQLLWKSLGA